LIDSEETRNYINEKFDELRMKMYEEDGQTFPKLNTVGMPLEENECHRSILIGSEEMRNLVNEMKYDEIRMEMYEEAGQTFPKLNTVGTPLEESECHQSILIDSEEMPIFFNERKNDDE
jgi:hypothetical protein